MNIFSWLGKQAKIPITALFGLGGQSKRFFHHGNKRNAGRDYKSWVYASTNAIAEEFSTIELGLFKRDSKGEVERVLDSPILEPLKTVNNFFTPRDLFTRYASNMELQGNEYWFVQRNGQNMPEFIFPLMPELVTPIPDERDYVSGYNYQIGDKTFKIDKEFIVHHKTYNPRSDILGISTIHAARAAADADTLAREYNQEFFLNGAMPGVILETPKNVTPEDQKRLRESWDENNAGRKRRFNTVVASGGLKIHQFSTTQKDMEFLEQRKFSRDEILAIFKVPPPILGIMETMTFASAKTANFVFVLRTIRPKMKRFVSTLNELYIPMFGELGKDMHFGILNEAPEDREQ